jgi:ubiquinone/menaquinone biosynthesis C-methylase UbiE
MNAVHRWLCRSDGWRKTIQERVPWVLGDADLGGEVLEVGPGPGLTTDFLRQRVRRLTALELDEKLAHALNSRMIGTNVDVIKGDATAMPFGDNTFSGAVSFTMLHHVPSVEMQNKLLREVRRVLKPGGVFAGSDSLQSLMMRLIHIGDTLVPVKPETFAERLETAGFEVLGIEKGAQAFRFKARRPLES